MPATRLVGEKCTIIGFGIPNNGFAVPCQKLSLQLSSGSLVVENVLLRGTA